MDEAIALRETHESPSGAHGDILREGKGRRKRGTPPILRRGGDFGSSPPSRASSSRRVSISLRDLDSASSHDSRDSDAEASFDSDAAASLSSATGSEDGSYGDTIVRRFRDAASSTLAAALARGERLGSSRRRETLRLSAKTRPRRSSAREARVSRAAARVASRRAARRGGFAGIAGGVARRSPWRSPRTTRFSPSPATTCPAGRRRPRRARVGAGDAVAFGQHWTTHGEAARARGRRRHGRGDAAARNPRRRAFSARYDDVPPAASVHLEPPGRARALARGDGARLGQA